MKINNIVITVLTLLTLTFTSCTEKDCEECAVCEECTVCEECEVCDDETSVMGTYTLTSAVPDRPVDTNADGSFTTENFINDISTPSRLILEEGETFVFEIINLGQYYNEGEYSEIQDNIYTQTGTYSVSDGSLILSYESSSTEVLSISDTSIGYTRSFWLVAQQDGYPIPEHTTVTFQYSK